MDKILTTQNRPVITGVYPIAPNGSGKDAFWKACLDGVSGISRIDSFDASGFKSKVCGRIKDFIPEQFLGTELSGRLDRFCQLGLTSSKNALKDSKIETQNFNPDRVGVYAGSGLGGILFHEDQITKFLEQKIKKVDVMSVLKIMPSSLSSHISLGIKALGPSMTISSACSSGLVAIGLASELIKSDKADLMIAGGAEAPLTYFTFAAFDMMRVLSRRETSPEKTSCPFDKKRDGFVLSEGAAFFTIEPLQKALKRNAEIYAEILGFGHTNSAYHEVIQQPDGKDIEKTMSLAIKDACIAPEDIGYINAHGTSTKSNDAIETRAIENVFGAHAKDLAVSSTKSMIGHPIGASGPTGIFAAAMSLKTGLIHPTINLDDPDPECGLNYVPNNAIKKNINYALVNSFGFGGTNCCIVLGKFRG